MNYPNGKRLRFLLYATLAFFCNVPRNIFLLNTFDSKQVQLQSDANTLFMPRLCIGYLIYSTDADWARYTVVRKQKAV